MVRAVCVKMASYFRCFSLAQLALLLDSNFERTLRLANVRAVIICIMSAPGAYSVYVATLFLVWQTIVRRAYDAMKGVLGLEIGVYARVLKCVSDWLVA